MLNEIDLSRADLNLLVLFEAVLEERHVRRAAERLNLTPSAVSHGLGRLRRLLNDPLFLRTPKGVVPTARATELAAPIAETLARVKSIISSAAPFDPATSSRRFTIGAPDAISAVCVPPLLDKLRQTAPGIDIGVRQLLPRRGEHPRSVPGEIRAALPRFQHLDDHQVLEASFKLSDAQELVARQLGFEAWQALKAGALAMNTQVKHATTPPILSGTEAQLYVADVKASCDFFISKLGFAIDFVYGDPPFYGMVRRDRARLCIRLVCEPVFVGDIRQREHLLSSSITVDTAAEIKQLFLDFQAAGVSFH
jgi:Bacterial regulatory helix-turn-helix protein, lysR family